MEFTLPLADLERLELILNDINGTSYIHERVEWLRERDATSEYADRLEEAYEDLDIYAGFLLAQDKTIAELERVAKDGYRQRPLKQCVYAEARWRGPCVILHGLKAACTDDNDREQRCVGCKRSAEQLGGDWP